MVMGQGMVIVDLELLHILVSVLLFFALDFFRLMLSMFLSMTISVS